MENKEERGRQIQQTTDHAGLYQMFYDNGLEVSPEGPDVPEKVIDCWEIVTPEEGRIAAAELEERAGEYIIGAIAVQEDHRREHLGQALMETAIERVKELGGDRLMLVAKVPEFYQKLGFTVIPRSESPDISHCFDCEQFQVDCFPQVMVLDLQEGEDEGK